MVRSSEALCNNLGNPSEMKRNKYGEIGLLGKDRNLEPHDVSALH